MPPASAEIFKVAELFHAFLRDWLHTTVAIRKGASQPDSSDWLWARSGVSQPLDGVLGSGEIDWIGKWNVDAVEDKST